jgi:hypothetical protein
MLKSVAMTLLSRLVFLAVIALAVNAYAYTRTSCSSGDSPFSQIGKAISSLNEIATALQKHNL